MTGSRYYLRSCKRGSTSTSRSKKIKRDEDSDSYEVFHESIIHNILIWLPASVLFNVMRFVCRTWFNIICSHRFKLIHLRYSPPGIILHSSSRMAEYACLRLTRDISANFNLKHSIPIHLPVAMKIMDSYKGMLVLYAGLVLPNTPPQHFYIFNPVTKQCLTYPVPPSTYLIRDLKLVPTSTYPLHYNALCVYQADNKNSAIAVLPLHGHTGTIEHTCWRAIPLDKKYVNKEKKFTHLAALRVGGYVYVPTKSVEGSSSGLLCVDVEREVAHEIPTPTVNNPRPSRWFLPRGGDFFGAIRLCSPEPGFDLWMLDMPSREWFLIFKFRPQLPASVFNPSGFAIAWIKNLELLVFGQNHGSHYFLCNIKTGKVTKTEDLDPEFCKNHPPKFYNYTESLLFL